MRACNSEGGDVQARGFRFWATSAATRFGKHERASAPMHRTRCIGADARYRIRELFHKLFGAFHALGEVTASCPWPGGRKPGG